MEDTKTTKDKKDIKSKDELNNIKSKYILQIICDYLKRKKSFEIFRYNRLLRNSFSSSWYYNGFFRLVSIFLFIFFFFFLIFFIFLFWNKIIYFYFCFWFIPESNFVRVLSLDLD